jgi:hypothetical protein
MKFEGDKRREQGGSEFKGNETIAGTVGKIGLSEIFF